MTMRHRLFLPAALLLTVAWAAAAPAQVRQDAEDRQLRSRPQPARQAADMHEQGVRQRRSPEQAESGPQDSRVDYVEPAWEYQSPEDADVLEGWGQRPPEAVRTVTEAGPVILSDRARAWRLYARGDYDAAARLFATAMDSPDRNEALNARLGLAYSLLRQGRREAAIAHLERLLDEGYRPAETRAALIQALAQSGRWEEARTQIAQLPPEKSLAWQRRLLEAQLLRDYGRMPATASADELAALSDAHSRAASMCIRPDVFHEIGRRLAQAGAPERANAIRRRLLECELPPDLRSGILSELADSLALDDALALLGRERERAGLSDAGTLAAIDAMDVRVLKRKMAALPPDSNLRAETAEAILRRDPDDRDARTSLAWHLFRSGRYDEAERLFGRLAEEEPGNRDIALGLGYARLNTGRPGTALSPLDRAGVPDDEDTIRLRKLVYRRQAAEAYEAGQFDRAAAHLESLLALDPADRDAKELLAWTRFKQNRPAEAETLMAEAFSERPSPGLAGGLLGLYTAAGDEERAWALADRLAHDPDPALSSSAAGFYFDRAAPVTAAQLDPDPDRCYTNAHSPRLEAFLYHRSKQGDGKYGDLEETALPITLVYPAELGRQWSASITPKHLAGHGGSAQPQAGRYYRSLNGAARQQDLEDNLFVVQPDVGFELEGRWHTAVHLGATPLNGPVDPTPTFQARVSAPGWFVDLHRCNVKDSILSYVGQKDPYSNDEWGRVTRNGAEAGATLPLSDSWWLSGSAGVDYYTGDSVRDNQAVLLDTAVGQTLAFDRDEFSYGLFLSARHFRRNSDFYTYGHGGYYSPELMTMIGPFARYRTAACRDYWFDVQASAGWLHQRLDSSPFYPLFDGDTTGFTPAAAADAAGEYDSDTDNKIGFNLRMQGMKLLTPHLAVGGFAAVNNSADYTEWAAGGGIQIFFDPQNLLWSRKDMFREFGKCSNK